MRLYGVLEQATEEKLVEVKPRVDREAIVGRLRMILVKTARFPLVN
jgi:hypothetical protein